MVATAEDGMVQFDANVAYCLVTRFTIINSGLTRSGDRQNMLEKVDSVKLVTGLQQQMAECLSG